jgi:hypothetical protein
MVRLPAFLLSAALLAAAPGEAQQGSLCYVGAPTQCSFQVFQNGCDGGNSKFYTYGAGTSTCLTNRNIGYSTFRCTKTTSCNDPLNPNNPKTSPSNNCVYYTYLSDNCSGGYHTRSDCNAYYGSNGLLGFAKSIKVECP